ncbi:hypothetical protein THIOKS12580081 [Thiocapsa sp. KS1]|nr:hypothetical protein THIOKS12580081 [Thiocapsa sp. KS1]
MKPPTEDSARADRLLSILLTFARESRVPDLPNGIGLDTRLEADLGLDSLGRSELIARVEKGLGVRLSDQALLAPTARDLLGLLVEGPGAVPDGGRAVVSVRAVEGHPVAAATLLDVLDWHLQAHADRVHILYEGETGTQPIGYRSLADGAARVAARLQAAGFHPGATVALMLPTGPDYFYSFFGVLMAGGIPVPIYPPSRPQQIEEHLRRHARILDNAGAAYLITVPEARAIGRVLRVQVRSLRGIVTLEGLEQETPSASRARPAAEDIAFLQYTSGSTGDPKGVVLTHADLLANIRAMGEVVQVAPDDVFVSWLPLYHDMGLIGAWLGSLYYGIPLISMSPLSFLARPMRWLEAIHRHGGTLSAAPNFAYELCLTRITDAQIAGLDLSRWRWALNGAEPVSPETLRRFAARFRPRRFACRGACACLWTGGGGGRVGLSPGRARASDRLYRSRSLCPRGLCLGGRLRGSAGDGGGGLRSCASRLPSARGRRSGPRAAGTPRGSARVPGAIGDARLLSQPAGDTGADPRRLARDRGSRLSGGRRHPSDRTGEGSHHPRRAQSLSLRGRAGPRRGSRRAQGLRGRLRGEGPGAGQRAARDPGREQGA